MRNLFSGMTLMALLVVGSFGPIPAHLQCLMDRPLSAQSPLPSPPEGNPNHEEPAPGSNCVHNPADSNHNCNCHKRCEQNPDGTNSAIVVEDNVRCRSACYKNHCACRADNCE